MSDKKMKVAVSKFFKPETKIKKGEIYDILEETEDEIKIKTIYKKITVPKSDFDIVELDEIIYKKIQFLINESCMLTTVFPAIVKERHYQVKKYGEDGNKHEMLTWICLIEQELKEAKREFFEGNPRFTLQELLQAITVGVACLENNLTVERDNYSNYNSCFREKKSNE